MPTPRSTPPSARDATRCSSPPGSPHSHMDIRPARPGDIPQLLMLVRRYWDFEGIKGFTALRIELVLKELLTGAAAPGAIWVAETQDGLTGYLVVVLVMSIEH